MTEIQAISNNLITQTINSSAQNNVQQVKKAEVVSDTFQKSTLKSPTNTQNLAKNSKISNKTLSKVIDAATSVILLGGLFFLPDLIFAVKNKKANNILGKYKNFKPIIGEVITSQKQETLKNGLTKITLENIKGKFKFNEIMIVDKKGNIKQRILIRKEELLNGKYIVRNVQSYKGNNLSNNKDLAKNYNKYLFKEYRRSSSVNKEYKAIIKRQNEETKVINCVGTADGKPVFNTTLTPTHKINTAYLYDNDRCIGIDKQFVPRSGKEEQYSIVNIPTQGIHNKQYDLNADGQQYDKRYLNKLLQNF